MMLQSTVALRSGPFLPPPRLARSTSKIHLCSQWISKAIRISSTIVFANTPKILQVLFLTSSKVITDVGMSPKRNFYPRVPFRGTRSHRLGWWVLPRQLLLKAMSLSQTRQLSLPPHSFVRAASSCLISATSSCTCESARANHTNRWQGPNRQLRTYISLNSI